MSNSESLSAEGTTWISRCTRPRRMLTRLRTQKTVVSRCLVLTSFLAFSFVIFRMKPTLLRSNFFKRTSLRLGSSFLTIDLYDVTPELNVSEIEQSSNCVRVFLTRYDAYCQIVMTSSDNAVIKSNSEQEFCSCVPSTLNETVHISRAPSNSTELHTAQQLNLKPGGQWAPSYCRARQRIAIIIPYKDRSSHLRTLLDVLHPFLQRQQSNYTIFLAEQMEPKKRFNKAMLMNAGFVEVRARGPFDCYIFHDVDMLPEDDSNIYSCSKSPRHVGVYINKWKYKLRYYRIFGGAIALRQKHMEIINGFSNEFWGWGGEDDDVLRRIETKNMTFIRYPRCVGRYTMIAHMRDKFNQPNPLKALGLKARPKVYDTIGLNSLQYKLAGSVEKKPRFTWIPINLPAPITTAQPMTGIIVSTFQAPNKTMDTNAV